MIDDEDSVELDVTLRFGVPVICRPDLEPREMANHFRDAWVEDPGALLDVVRDAILEDFDLQVMPVHIF